MIKYLFKYISKGADRVRYTIQKAEYVNESSATASVARLNGLQNEDVHLINEVHNFLDGCYICPQEAAWRIFNFHIHHCHPPIQVLTMHEENMQHLVFNGNNSIPKVLSNLYSSITTLLGWFESNSKDTEGHDLTYLEYPKHYRWDKPSKSWGRRVHESSKMVGRLVFVYLTFGELFYLRMLLCHQKGCTSFQDLRTVAGTVYPTFRAA